MKASVRQPRASVKASVRERQASVKASVRERQANVKVSVRERQARAGKDTRQAIEEAALDAFAENGYAGASLRDIARRVGIEVASLYNHIDSKEELLFRIIETSSHGLLNVLRSEIASVRSDDPRQRLLRATAINITYHAAHPKHSFIGNVELRSLEPLHYEEAMRLRQAVDRTFVDLVAECIAAGYLPADTPTKVLAYHLLAIGTSVPAWFNESGPCTPEEVASCATNLILYGLRKR